MDEQKTDTETKTETTTPAEDAGSKSEADSLVDKARIEADRIEAANEESKRILAQQQELEAKKLLGGTSDAGTTTPKLKEESAIEYANAFARGERGNPLIDLDAEARRREAQS